jgi:hypothetical protein
MKNFRIADTGGRFGVPHFREGSKMAEDIPEAGMTLRDVFAAFALAGLIANPSHEHPSSAADHAYQYADAMMLKRDEHGTV